MSNFPPPPRREPMVDQKTNMINRVWFFFFDNFGKALDAVIPSLQAAEQALVAANDTINALGLDIVTINDALNSLNTNKQNNLVSGTSIKTINDTSILGSGNIDTFTPPVLSSHTVSYTEAQTRGTAISICDATSGDITITLPDCSLCQGMVFIAKKKDSSANLVILDAYGSQEIDGSTTRTITAQYESIRIVSDGSTWYGV